MLILSADFLAKRLPAARLPERGKRLAGSHGSGVGIGEFERVGHGDTVTESEWLATFISKKDAPRPFSETRRSNPEPVRLSLANSRNFR